MAPGVSARLPRWKSYGRAAMPSPHLPEPQTLVEPLAGGRATGVNLRSDMVFSDINKARTRQTSVIAGEPDVEPDWDAVVSLTSKALRERSKDLRLAAWLIEGLVQVDGFAGLRTGLWVMRELADRFWEEGLHPFDEESADETAELRAGPFSNLMQVDRGMFLPGKVRDIRLFDGECEGRPYSYSLFKSFTLPTKRDAEADDDYASRCAAVERRRADFEAARRAMPLPRLRQLVEDIDGSLAELKGLDESFGKRLERHGVSAEPLRAAIAECRQLAFDTLKEREPVEGDAPVAGGGAGEGPSESNPIRSRQQAYRWLSHIAAYLREHDPHSPVPDRIDRAAAYGRMSFHELRMQLMHDAETGGFAPLDSPPPPYEEEPAEPPPQVDAYAEPEQVASETAAEQAPGEGEIAGVEPTAGPEKAAGPEEAAAAPDAAAIEAPRPAPSANGHARAAGAAPRLTSRSEALLRLTQVADYLARCEPNSPVPSMVRTAVAWGSMPFERLMETLYPDATTREKVGTLVGIKSATEAAP